MASVISRAVQFEMPDDPAAAIRLAFAPLAGQLKIGGADVLIGIWMPDENQKTKGGLFLTAKTRDEYLHQGNTGLVLALGPHAYRTEKTGNWFQDADGNPDAPQVGEWVMFDYKQGAPFLIGTAPYRLINDQYVLMRIPRPDLTA